MALPRILRMSGTLAIVLVAYYGYRLLAVPWIEPAAEGRSQTQPVAAMEPVDRMAPFRQLFQPGDPELDERTRILESDQVKLLWGTLTDRGDGTVELRPCTFIFAPNGAAADESQRGQGAIVLQAREGAELTFSQPLDLRRGSFGRLLHGRMSGPIVLRGQGRSPGPEDDLSITTRDLLMKEECIWTTEDVDLRFGPNSLRGTGMQIDLLPGDDAEDAKLHGLNVAGVRSVEIHQLQGLRLFIPAGSLETRSADRPVPTTQAPIPVEITCQGVVRFELDLAQPLVAFHDQVDVRVLQPNGPSDQVNCERLTLWLQRRRPQPAQAGANEPKSQALDLEPAKIEAVGRPVSVHAPSQKAMARGTRLFYDFALRRIELEDSDDPEGAMLRQGPAEAANEIHAPWIEYSAASEGRLGRADAKGRGWLRAFRQDRPSQSIEAQWTQRLSLTPYEEQHLISLVGDAQLRYGLLGHLVAPEIYFWLFELPPSSQNARAELRPDRMWAGRKQSASRREVLLNSPQASGAIDQLQVWFEQGSQPSLPAPSSPPSPSPRAASSPPHRLETAVTRAAPFSASASLRRVWRPIAGGAGETLVGAHFQIDADLLQAQVVMAGERSELSGLILDGSVNVRETRTERPGDEPVVITGDRVQMVDASQPYAYVTVTGSPAHFEGRTLGLTGPNINLNRGTNKLWIDGPGRLDLVLPRDLQGREIPGGLPLRIEWKKRMRPEDARTIRFEGAVVASTQNQQLRAESLDAIFQQPLQFSDPKRQAEPKIEQIRCGGGVVLESRTFDTQGLASFERIEVPDLAIQLVSGELLAGARGAGRTAAWPPSAAAVPKWRACRRASRALPATRS